MLGLQVHEWSVPAAPAGGAGGLTYQSQLPPTLHLAEESLQRHMAGSKHEGHDGTSLC